MQYTRYIIKAWTRQAARFMLSALIGYAATSLVMHCLGLDPEALFEASSVAQRNVMPQLFGEMMDSDTGWVMELTVRNSFVAITQSLFLVCLK